MKKLLLILMLGIAQYANAQHYFNTRTPLHSFATVITSVVPENGLYYCTSVAWDSSNYLGNGQATNAFGVNFSIFDSIGNVIRDTIYQLPGLRNIYPWNNSLYPMPDKGFLLAAGDDIDTFDKYHCLLIRYDSIGDVLWTKEFDKPFCADTSSNPLWVMMDMKPTGTGEWLVLSDPACYYDGPYGPTNIAKFVLTKLDSSFNIEWNKEYSEPGLNLLPSRLLVTAAGYLMGGGVDNDIYIDQPGSLINRAEMIMTDTAGNQQWLWQSNANEENGGVGDVVQTYDGGWVYCSAIGYSISAGGGDSEIEGKGWIEKLDANRNPVWNHVLGSGWSSNNSNNQVVLKQLPDSSIVVAGTVVGGFNGEGDTLLNYGSLSKFKADGSVVWEHKYQVPNDYFYYTIYDMKQTPDGGFVLSGEANSEYAPITYPSDQGWLLKVDSNGCAGPDDPQCWPAGVPASPGLSTGGEVSISVYPNPADDEVTVANAPLGSEMKIYNILGQQVLNTVAETNTIPVTINTINLPNGSYILQITTPGGNRSVQKIIIEK